MDSAVSLQRLRDTLGAIDRENAERFALIDTRAGKAAQESNDTTERLASNAREVFARLDERAQRIKNAGGWATGSSLANSGSDEDDFGFEEDDQAAATPAEHVPATQAPPFAPAPVSHCAQPPDKSDGHLRRSPAEEDDYAETDWTSD